MNSNWLEGNFDRAPYHLESLYHQGSACMRTWTSLSPQNTLRNTDKDFLHSSLKSESPKTIWKYSSNSITAIYVIFMRWALCLAQARVSEEAGRRLSEMPPEGATDPDGCLLGLLLHCCISESESSVKFALALVALPGELRKSLLEQEEVNWFHPVRNGWSKRYRNDIDSIQFVSKRYRISHFSLGVC